MFRQCGKIVATAWKDNRVVNVANTLADPTQLATVKRRQKDGTRINVDCPLCIALYNEYIGGVDYNDHLRGSYHVRWKCMKNYKYVFCFLLDVSTTNAHSFDVRSGPPMDQKHFCLTLAEQLIGTYMSRKRAGRLGSVPVHRAAAAAAASSLRNISRRTPPSVTVCTVRISALSPVGRSRCGCVQHVKESRPCA